MISSLHGKLEAFGGDWAIINVSGVGFKVHIPTSTLSTLGTTGEEVHLHTHLVLREDNVSLYGFASTEELSLFQTLLGVSGFGPRLALAMLSKMSAEQVSTAIATGNVDLLRTIPGIGKKTAERLILELKDKIGAGLVATPAGQLAQQNADVLAFLLSLGYTTYEASRAVASLPSSPDLSLEEKARLALQYFTSQ